MLLKKDKQDARVAPAPEIIEKDVTNGVEPFVRRVEYSGGLKIVSQGKGLPPLIAKIESSDYDLEIGDLVLVFNHPQGNKLGQYASKAYIQKFLKSEKKGALRIKRPRQYKTHKADGLNLTQDNLIASVEHGTPLENIIFPGDKLIDSSGQSLILERAHIDEVLIREALQFCNLLVTWSKTKEIDIGQRRHGRCRYRDAFFYSPSLKFILSFQDDLGRFSLHIPNEKKKHHAPLRSKLEAAVDYINKQRRKVLFVPQPEPPEPSASLNSSASQPPTVSADHTQKDGDYTYDVML